MASYTSLTLLTVPAVTKLSAISVMSRFNIASVLPLIFSYLLGLLRRPSVFKWSPIYVRDRLIIA